MKNKTVLYISFFALFSSIISLSCLLKIPFGPIPITFQNSICILSGTILGGTLAAFPTVIFLLAGLIGLPVYSGGTCGISIWLGPTGGFLLGYFFGSVIAGIVARRPMLNEKKKSIQTVVKITLAVLFGTFAIYIPGVFHFLRWAKKIGTISDFKSGFIYALNVCVFPCIPGDLLKSFICILIALKVRPIIAQYSIGENKLNKEQ